MTDDILENSYIIPIMDSLTATNIIPSNKNSKLSKKSNRWKEIIKRGKIFIKVFIKIFKICEGLKCKR